MIVRLGVKQSALAVTGCALAAVCLVVPLSSPIQFVLAMAFLAAVVLASVRSGGTLDKAILIIVLAIVFAYFVRYFVVIVRADLLYFLVPSVARPALNSPAIWEVALAYTTAAFIVLITGAVVCRPAYIEPTVLFPSPISLRVSPSLILLFAVAGFIALDLLMVHFGIGRQGEFVKRPLPYNLTGAIVYLKAVAFPCLFGVCIFAAQQQGRPRFARLAAIVLLASASLDMMLFASRGALLSQLLFVVLIWFFAGFRVTRLDVLLIIGTAVGALFAVPIVTLLRLYDVSLQSFSIEQVSVGLTFVMFRITGIEQLMIILDLARPIPLDALWDVLTSTRGIPGFYTSNIIGSSDQVPQTFAPSGLGWLYLFGGLPAILSGAAFMGPFLVFSWKAIDRFIPQLAHAVRAFLVMYLIILVTEGAMGAVIMRTTIGVATFWLAERLLVTRATGARSLGYLTRMPASSG